MKIALGSDHRGVYLKERIKAFLEGEGCDVTDYGTNTDETVDYIDFALTVARAVGNGDADRGVLICWTGIGMCITANKVKNIRAFVAYEPFTARLSKEHNDTNIICFGGGVIGPDLALITLREWLQSSYSGGRHEVRLSKIKTIEEENFK